MLSTTHSPVIIANISTLDEYNQLTQSHPFIVIDCYAQWCGPCKTIAPYFQQFANTYRNVCFVKVDADEEGDLTSALEIQNLPTFILVGSGRVHKLVGADVKKLETAIQTLIGKF